jgi:chromate transporter
MKNVCFQEALAVWIKIGLLSFGGPAAQIALMHRVIVEEKKWLDESRFLHALNYCMLLPGPEAQQLATYVGWLLHGVKGAITAGLLFILPGALAIFIFSWIYVSLGDLSIIQGLFFGLKAAVLAIVVQALIRIGRHSLQTRFKMALAMSGFIALFVFDLPFPLVVLGAGFIGYIFTRQLIAKSNAEEKTMNDAETVVRAGTKTAALVCFLLWAGTVVGLIAILGQENVYSHIALFFSKMATVTFGGAYAVLAYVAQQGVEHFQWLQPGEMLQGIGLAETTPGPLILVTQFVGFLAAYRESGLDSSLLAATIGALLTTWITFLPCFLWIFAGAPYVERLRSNQAISTTLAAITAVVVGVIANLALWFAISALFSEHYRIAGFGVNIRIPEMSSVDLPMLVLVIVAFICAFKFRMGVLSLIGTCAALGILWVM